MSWLTWQDYQWLPSHSFAGFRPRHSVQWRGLNERNGDRALSNLELGIHLMSRWRQRTVLNRMPARSALIEPTRNRCHDRAKNFNLRLWNCGLFVDPFDGMQDSDISNFSETMGRIPRGVC